MYYEESLINGVLMFRTSPLGAWRQCSIEKVCRRLVRLKEALIEIADLPSHRQDEAVVIALDALHT